VARRWRRYRRHRRAEGNARTVKPEGLISSVDKATALNGTGVAMIAAGTIVGYSGIANASIPDTLRSVLKGKAVVGSTVGSVGEALGSVKVAPASAASSADPTAINPVTDPQAGFGIGQSVINAAIVAAASKYIGVPYRFGGATPDGWDCSGFVTWVLHHELGLNLPSNKHTVTGQFYVWKGAKTVPWLQMQPGDLICYTGHIGIAITESLNIATIGKGNSGAMMIDAPHTGAKTRKDIIWRIPQPLVRRVIGQ
jgi:cell wall-associated NlpC family hydrolase